MKFESICGENPNFEVCAYCIKFDECIVDILRIRRNSRG